MIIVTVLLQIGFVEDKFVINESNETVNIEIYKNGLTSLSLNASLQIYYNTTGKQLFQYTLDINISYYTFGSVIAHF